MRTKRSMLIFVSAIIFVLAVISPVIAQDTLTISFPAVGDPRSETVNALIDQFVAAKADEGVTVEVVINEPTEGYNDQLLLDFSAGVGPDVFSISAETIPGICRSRADHGAGRSGRRLGRLGQLPTGDAGHAVDERLGLCHHVQHRHPRPVLPHGCA